MISILNRGFLSVLASGPVLENGALLSAEAAPLHCLASGVGNAFDTRGGNTEDTEPDVTASTLPVVAAFMSARIAPV